MYTRQPVLPQLDNTEKPSIQRWADDMVRELKLVLGSLQADLIEGGPAESAAINGVKRAFCKTAAPAGRKITAYLNVDSTGPEITVNCDIAGGSNLNEAAPRLLDGTPITVYQVGSNWYCTTLFQATEVCS